MLKSLLSILIILSLTLVGCSSGVGGLKNYVDAKQGYEFLYPNGWISVQVENASAGVDVVFRDIIERSENLSVVISDIPDDKNLTDLGTPSEVGYIFMQQVNSNPNLNREAELITAAAKPVGDKTYYILEYQVELPSDQERHNLASVVVSRGKLFTFNLSTNQRRWEKVKTLFEIVVNSFSVY